MTALTKLRCEQIRLQCNFLLGSDQYYPIKSQALTSGVLCVLWRVICTNKQVLESRGGCVISVTKNTIVSACASSMQRIQSQMWTQLAHA
jgi:hypothetical protein